MSILIGNFNEIKLHINEYDRKTHKNKVKCNVCNNIIIGKKGGINAHHYAHINTKCIINRDKDSKTKWHMMWQNIAKKQYLEKIINKEKKIHIADIINEDNVVIEVQHSNLSEEEIKERENFYDNMIWILDASDFIKKDKKDNTDYLVLKSSCIFYTNNNYYLVKFTNKFWCKMNKKKYVDMGDGMYEIIKYIGNNFYICKNIKYIDFLNLYYKNILILNSEDTNDIIISHHKKRKKFILLKKQPGGTLISKLLEYNDDIFDIYQKNIYYCEYTNSFSGKGTYNMRYCFRKLGYTFDRLSKQWVIKLN